MGTYISSRVGLVGNAPLPACYLAGSGKDIPVIEWTDGEYGAETTISFGNLDDPATYLRDLAAALRSLADAFELCRDSAPVPYVLTEAVQS